MRITGTELTFPVYLFSQLRFASRLPVMIAFAVLMTMGTLLLVLIAEWIRRRVMPERRERPSRRQLFPRLPHSKNSFRRYEASRR